MKKLFKQFDKLKIDTDLEPMELNELEKARVKQNVLRSTKKNRMPKIASATVAVAAATFITFGVAFPTLAAKLPIVGNLFESFADEKSYVFDKFADYSSDIGITKESNGIQVTVTDAIYDGENITIAYTMTSDHDLGERPILEGKLHAEEFGDAYEHYGYAPTDIGKKISDTEYAGLFVYQLIQGPKPEEIHVTWDGNMIVNLDNVNNHHAGDWAFQLKLNALEASTNDFAEKDVDSETAGIQIDLKKITETPVSATIYLSELVDIPVVADEDTEWRGTLIEYEVTDDLGNEYNAIHFKDIGHSTDFKNRSSNPRITTTLFHPNASAIYVTPTVNVVKMINSEGDLELDKEPYAMEPLIIPLNK